MSEQEEVNEKAPEINLEDFRGLVEYMSKFFTRARLPFGDLPEEISQNILGTDNGEEHINYRIAFYLGAIDRLMGVLREADFIELARDFFTSQENNLRYMRIISDLATLLFDIQNKKITDKHDIINKLDEITDRLKAFIMDLLQYLDRAA